MSDEEQDASNGDGRRTGGVQSIARAFAVLELIAAHGGAMGLSRLATDSGLPLPTLHRLARTLVDLGYLRQEPSGSTPSVRGCCCSPRARRRC